MIAGRRATPATGLPAHAAGGATTDMANACLFLLSDKAVFVAGTESIVEGGITAMP